MPSPSFSDFDHTTVQNPGYNTLSNGFNTITREQQQQRQQQQQLLQLQQLQQLQQFGQGQLLLQQYQQLQNAGVTLDANTALSALNSLTSETNNATLPGSSLSLQPASTTVTQAVSTVARPTATATATKAAKGRSGTLTTTGKDPTPTSQSLQPLTRATNNGTRGNVNNFLSKLYNIVSNPVSNDLIHWSEDGDSFIVTDQVRFAKEVLPKFFKHNLFTSFVRQLNMYDFHKVPHLQQGVLMPDSDSEHCEFSHSHFQRDQPDLLHLVERKKAPSSNNSAKAGQDNLMSTITGGSGNGVGISSLGAGVSAAGGVNKRDALTLDLGHIVKEVNAIKRHQVAISTDLRNIERDHQSLWQESIAARERHQRQQETIDKILRFLASVFSGEKRAIVPHKKARLTITDGETARNSGVANSRRLVEAESDNGEDLDEDDGAEEIVLSGSKRKRSQVDNTSDNQQSSFNISELTPETLATLSNAKQTQQKPTAISTAPTTTTSTTTTSTAGLPTIPTLSSVANTLTSTSTIPDYLLPSLLNYAQQNANKANSSTNDPKIATLQFDPSNLPLPTTLHPNVLTSPAHHDMLRSISIANARDTTQNAQSLAPPLLPPNPSSLSSSTAALLAAPTFSQTPAGAHITRGVDQIVMDQERLQKSLDALGQHGLNIENFDLDDDFDSGGRDDDYFALGEHFDPYPAMGSYQDTMNNFSDFDQSHDTTHQFNQLQNFMSSHPVSFPGGGSTTAATTSSPSAVPAWSNNTNIGVNANNNNSFHVGANPRITTVGEDRGLEELLDLGPS
ncbi:stress-responsive transcription factor hsf1 [Linnemannia zychae]|nr:stress-responsive transcription factor hsf1 [Linnemannia zychae]